MLREAITKTNKVALARVVISQRERTVALRPMGVGPDSNVIESKAAEEGAPVKPPPRRAEPPVQPVRGRRKAS